MICSSKIGLLNELAVSTEKLVQVSGVSKYERNLPYFAAANDAGCTAKSYGMFHGKVKRFLDAGIHFINLCVEFLNT